MQETEYAADMKGEHIRKSHNVSYLIYHFVCPIKNRRKVLGEPERVKILKEICEEIELNYEIYFLEVGSDIDHVHFLIQSVLDKKPLEIATTIKSLTGREMFGRIPELRKELLGGKFRTSGYYVNTVGRHTSEETIRAYVRDQGSEEKRDYKVISKGQLKIF